MSWYKYNGYILRENGQTAVDASCCCGVVCCDQCPALSGYTGDLCATFSGVGEATHTLNRATVLNECDTWIGSGEVSWTGGCFFGDPLTGLDIEIRCLEGQAPEIKLAHSEGQDSEITDRDLWLSADSIDCGTTGTDPFTFVKSYAVTGVCSGTLTVTIEKC